MGNGRSNKPGATSDQGETGSAGPSAETMAWIGAILTLAGPAGVLFIYLSGRGGGGGVALAVITGFMLLGLTLTGLIVTTRAMGLSDPDDALALPPGSVRALLALGLVIVFVGVAGWIMGPGLNANDAKSDLVKQILSVSATVLVMVIGFYFGSKGAHDAASAARGSIKTVTEALGIAQGAGAGSSAVLSSDDAAGIVNSIKAMAQSTRSKLEQLGDQPLRPLGDIVSKASPAMHEQLSAKVNEAAEIYQTMQARAQTCDSLARGATEVTAGLAAPGAALTQDATQKLTSMRDDAEDANKEFEADLAKFNGILAEFRKL
jgi:hypothetical protein